MKTSTRVLPEQLARGLTRRNLLQVRSLLLPGGGLRELAPKGFRV